MKTNRSKNLSYLTSNIFIMWMKKDSWFNVTIGAYLGAEVCKVVGIFSLDKISVKYDKNSIGLYYDNGL